MSARYPQPLLQAVADSSVLNQFEPNFPGAHERNLGARKACAWVLAIHGRDHDRTVVVDPGIELDWSKQTGLSRVRFARLAIDTYERLEARFGFKRQTGYAQVLKRDARANQAYGFYDMLGEILTRFDLWDVPEETQG